MSQHSFYVVLGIAIVVAFLLARSLVLFVRLRTVGMGLQLLGTGCFTVVVLTHVFEQFRFFPRMGWGRAGSAGHYVDLWSAIAGVAIFYAGVLLEALRERRGKRAAREKASGQLR